MSTISYSDNAVLRILAGLLDQGLSAGGYFLADGTTTFPVVQKDQPTQQGIPSDPTVYFQKLFDKAYGFPSTKNVYESSTDTFVSTETQLYETTVQISSLVIQNPSNPDMPTASDVTNYMKMYVGSVYTARNLQKTKGIGILRVTEVRNEPFEDDKNRFEYHPNFDIVFTYTRVINFSVPAAHKVVPATVEGFGQGDFWV